MILKANLVMTGVAARPGYKDPSQINYMVAFADGIDSVRLYIDRKVYDDLASLPPFSKLAVEFDFNPAASSPSYALRLHDYSLAE